MFTYLGNFYIYYLPYHRIIEEIFFPSYQFVITIAGKSDYYTG